MEFIFTVNDDLAKAAGAVVDDLNADLQVVLMGRLNALAERCREIYRQNQNATLADMADAVTALQGKAQ